jgi:hypothetical protein
MVNGDSFLTEEFLSLDASTLTTWCNIKQIFTLSLSDSYEPTLKTNYLSANYWVIYCYIGGELFPCEVGIGVVKHERQPSAPQD